MFYSIVSGYNKGSAEESKERERERERERELIDKESLGRARCEECVWFCVWPRIETHKRLRLRVPSSCRGLSHCLGNWGKTECCDLIADLNSPLTSPLIRRYLPGGRLRCILINIILYPHPFKNTIQLLESSLSIYLRSSSSSIDFLSMYICTVQDSITGITGHHLSNGRLFSGRTGVRGICLPYGVQLSKCSVSYSSDDF